MRDLFNPKNSLVDEPIDEASGKSVEQNIEYVANTFNHCVTSSLFRRAFKRPPKTRLHAEAISPGDAIKACTVRPNERLSVLSSLNIQQEENMEPLPEFSRDMRHAHRRYQKAVIDAQDEAERAKKKQNGENGE